jgi:hypothetical protein
MMSNDDWPESYHDFMNSTRRPYLIAALCPKFKKLRRDDDPRKEIDATLQALQERGYRLYFWVIERKWGDQASVVGRDELSELRRYGTVEVFAGQDVESDQRARRFRSFVSDVVLP